MPQLGRDRPDDEGPFLFPDPRADLFAAPGFELEGPFLPAGTTEAAEAAPANAAQVAVGKSASAVASRARFAGWSDADDRRKGRNPRDQDAGVVAAEAPSNVLEYPMPAADGRRVFLLQNFKIDGAALRPEHQTFLQTIAAWVKGQGAASRSSPRPTLRARARRRTTMCSRGIATWSPARFSSCSCCARASMPHT
jgi:hypothetical protein